MHKKEKDPILESVFITEAEAVWNSIHLCVLYCFMSSFTVEIIHLVPYSAIYRLYFSDSVPKVGPIPTHS